MHLFVPYHQTTILTPTAEEAEIYQCACQLFDELWDGEQSVCLNPEPQIAG